MATAIRRAAPKTAVWGRPAPILAAMLGSVRSRWPRLYRLALAVPDHQDFAVLDDVLLALQTELTLVASAGIAAEIDQRLPVHHLGANELLFEIGVNGAE